MSRYKFKCIREPEGEQHAPFAVFGVVTQGHERLMNTAGHRYEAVAKPAAEETGLAELLLPGGFLDHDKLEALRKSGDGGLKQVMEWSNRIANAQIDWTCQRVAILTHRLSGELTLLNPDLEGVEWPKFDWKAPEETVRQRADILMAYIPQGDVEGLKAAALAHYKGEQLPPGELGNSRAPSSAPLNGAPAAPSPTTAAPAPEMSV